MNGIGQTRVCIHEIDFLGDQRDCNVGVGDHISFETRDRNRKYLAGTNGRADGSEKFREGIDFVDKVGVG